MHLGFKFVLWKHFLKQSFLHLLQVKSEQVQILQAPKTITVSRRDIIQYAATKSLVGFALLFSEPAEARVGRLENKKKAMEKLREKSRVFKPKGEAPPVQKSPDDKSLPTFPLPPQGGRVARLVEATHNNI